MADSPLITKSKEFALQIIKVCNYVKQTQKESVLTNQLIRSGTSVGANIREAFYGHGTADFIAKLQIALKECSESEYWIELLIESGYYDNNDILEKCIEVKKLLISSLNTAKSKLKQTGYIQEKENQRMYPILFERINKTTSVPFWERMLFQ